jgi:GH24 family phage-related lysozyme (muramidase)
LVIWNFYKKITRYRTPTKHQITLWQRIMLHIISHHRDKSWRATDRQKESVTKRCARNTGYSLAESWTRKTGEQAVNTNSWHRRINCGQWQAESTSTPRWRHEDYSISNSEHIRRMAL